MPVSKPPRFAENLLRWYSQRNAAYGRGAQIDDLQGDIEELFHEDVKCFSVARANRNYWRRVISLLFSYTLTKRRRDAAYHHFSHRQFTPGMFKNYFKTAVRNLAKNKFFATVNVFGLAVGMTLSLLFVAMMVFEFQFDNFHPNRANIYRVITHVQDRDRNPSYASAPIGTAPILKNFSGVEKVVRIHNSLEHEVGYGDTKISLSGYFTDPEFLSVFNFPLLQGNPLTALSKPNTMVLTEDAAAKLFGDNNPVGELAHIDPFGEVMITGVLKNRPKNTHMVFEALVSFTTLTSYHGASFAENEKNWNDFFNCYTYLQLSDKVAPTSIETFLNGIAQTKYTTNDFKAAFALQRLDKIVPAFIDLHNNIGSGWSYESMLLNGFLPLVILLAACSNYVSLAISQSLRRIREIGVRKVMGGQKKHIFMQFILESTIIMLLALTLSYFFFEIIRDDVLAIAEETSIVDLNPSLGTYAGFIVFALLVGLFSGIIPALHFAKLSPVNALKGKELQTKRSSQFSIRKVVITMQFMLSLGFIMVVVIMVQQYRFSVNYDLGFRQEGILNVELQQADPQLVKNEFEKLSFARSISMSSHALGTGSVPELYVRQTENSDSIKANTLSVDENLIANLGLKLLRGKNFTDNAMENQRLIVINEVFANKLSPDDPYNAIDQVIILPGKREVKVAGIVQDFNYASLSAPIGNLLFEYEPRQFRYANIHLETTDIRQAFSEMEAAWKPVGKGDKFISAYLSDQIRDAYGFYFMMVKIWGFFGMLAITIACLGLLGTVVFTVKNRVKEVSIRKVMGASSESLVYLLSKDFIILMFIASIITVPTVKYVMEWVMLTAQYYNVAVGTMEIGVSLLIVFVLGMITILSQTLKAANTNPVDNLRVE